MAAPAKFAHVVFRSGRLAEMRDWYCNVLEAHVAFENDFIVFLTYDDEHHRIAIVDTGATEAPPATASGVEHIAFTYGSLDDLVGTYERLKGQGLEPYWTINHGPTTSCYYRDPDGNQVELQIDNFESTEALNAWFRSGAFAENPIGVEFDPEELVARYRAGVPHEELVRRP
jgi:catechol-2,3-dioxygenase